MAQTIEAGTNDVYLIGVVEQEPIFVYNERGYRMFEGLLEVERRSGEVDHLPFVGDEDMIGELAFGERVAIGGMMHHRDRGSYPETKNRTAVFVLSISYAPANWPAQNSVKLSGHICRPTNFRVTPRGRELCELTVAVPRGNGHQDYIVCIAWNDCARSARSMTVGQAVSVTGRFQSREYRKNVGGTYETRVTHEVSLDSLQ